MKRLKTEEDLLKFLENHENEILDTFNQRIKTGNLNKDYIFVNHLCLIWSITFIEIKNRYSIEYENAGETINKYFQKEKYVA